MRYKSILLSISLISTINTSNTSIAQNQCPADTSLTITTDCTDIITQYSGAATQFTLYFDGAMLEKFSCPAPTCTHRTRIPANTDLWVSHSWIIDQAPPLQANTIISQTRYGSMQIDNCFNYHYNPVPQGFVPTGVNIAYGYPKLARVEVTRGQSSESYLAAVKRFNPVTIPAPELLPFSRLLNANSSCLTGEESCAIWSTSAHEEVYLAIGKYAGVTALFVTPMANDNLSINGGSDPAVKIFNYKTGELLHTIAQDAGHSIAVADFNSDGNSDLVLGAPVGSIPYVKIVDGVSGAEIKRFQVYASTFRGGVRVATALVNDDTVPDLITAPGAGDTGVVYVLNGINGSEIKRFNPFGTSRNSLGYNISAIRDTDSIPVVAVAGAVSADGNFTLEIREFNALTGQQIGMVKPKFGIPSAETAAGIQATVALARFSSTQQKIRDGVVIGASSYYINSVIPPSVQLIDVPSGKVYSYQFIAPIRVQRPSWINNSLQSITLRYLPSVAAAPMDPSDPSDYIR